MTTHTQPGAREIALWVFLGSVVLAIAAGLLGFVLPGFRQGEQLLVTVLIFGGYTLVGMVSAYALERRRLRPIVVPGLVLLAISMVGWIGLVWLDSLVGWRVEKWFLQINGTIMLFGSVLVHFSLCHTMIVEGVFPKAARHVAVGGALLGGVLIFSAIWFHEWLDEFGFFDEWYPRFIGIGVLLAVGGLLVVLVMARLEKHGRERGFESTIAKSIPVSIRCPRCSHAFVARTNRKSRCESCRLRIRVDVEEPRCVCGYILYQLPGDTCPECGRTIPEEDRWRAAQVEARPDEPLEREA